MWNGKGENSVYYDHGFYAYDERRGIPDVRAPQQSVRMFANSLLCHHTKQYKNI